MSFIDELQNAARTPEEVADEEWEKTKEYLRLRAELRTRHIKEQLLNEVKNGHYQNIEGKKIALIKYRESGESRYSEFLSKKKDWVLEKKTLFSSGKNVPRLTIKIDERQRNEFDYYFKNVQEICAADKISITPIIGELPSAKVEYSLPMVFQGYAKFNHSNSYDLFFKCWIEF